MGYDGSLKFDTEINEAGFNKGVKAIDKSVKKVAENVVSAAEKAVDKTKQASNQAEVEVSRAANKAEKSVKKSGSGIEAATKKTAGSVVRSAKEVENAVRKVNETTKKSSSGSLDSLKALGEKGLGTLKEAAIGAVGGVGAALGEAVLSAGEKVVSSANEMQQALNQFAAATGTGKDELYRYQEVMEEIFANGYGESFLDISGAMSTITQQLGKMDDSSLQNLTESAIVLRDTFGYQVKESVRASKVMMDRFGISGEDAMNLISNGAQNGLDSSGKFMISISEYSARFSELGLSADDMFHIFQTGAESSTANLDKIGEALSELSTGAIEGSDTTAKGFESLGINADEMAAKFASGGEGAREAFQQVISGLAEMDDPVEQSTAGVNLFGTMWEDLGPGVVEQLANIGDAAYGSKTALEDMKEVRYDDVSSSLATLGKTVMTKFIDPIADVALPVVKDAIDGITEALDPPKTEFEEFVDGIEASNKEIEASVKHTQGIMDNAAGEAAKVEEYKNILLELNDVSKKNEYQKHQMRTIVSELADSVPQLAAAFDEETASLNLNNQEIANYMDDHANLLQQQAAIEAQTEAYDALFKAKLNQAKADGAYTEARKQWNKVLEESDGTNSDARMEAEKNLAIAEASRQEAREGARDAQKESRITADAIKQTTDALGGEAEAAKKSAEASKMAAESKGESVSAAEQQAAALEALNEKYTEFRGQLEQDIQNKISLFSGFDGGQDITVEDMLANLQAQKEGLQNWKSNMETLANEVGTTITPEFYNAILEMGPEAANAVQHMVTTLDQSNGRELLADMAQTWGENMDFSGSAATGLSNTGATVETGLRGILNVAQKAGIHIPKELSDGILDGSMDLSTATTQMGDAIKNNMGGIEKAAADAGLKIPPEIKSGLEQGGQAAVDAMQALVDQMQEKGLALGEVGKEQGGDLGQETASGIEDSKGEVAEASAETGKAASEGVADGIKEGESQVTGAVDTTMKSAVSTGNGYKESFNDVGYNLMTGTVAGITKGSPAVEKAARDAVSKAVAAAREEGKVESPSKVFRDEVGIYLPQGMAQGIKNGTDEVEQASADMAQASIDATKEKLDINSPSGVFKEEVGKQIVAGIEVGIKTEQEKLNVAMRTVSQEALEAARQVTDQYSDVGRSIMDSIAEGLEEREAFTSKRIEQVIDQQIEKVTSGSESKANRLDERARKNEETAEKYRKKEEAARRKLDKAKEEGDKKKADKHRKEIKEQKKQKNKYSNKAKKNTEEAEAIRKASEEAGEVLRETAQEAVSQAYEKIREETNAIITEISDKYQKLFDEIDAKQKNMLDKMSSPSNMYDLDTQLEQIKRYQNGLGKLKNKIPDSLMQEILGMDMTEADNMMEYLNDLTDEQFADYISKWEKIQNQAQKYSTDFFAEEKAQVKADYEKEIVQAMNDVQAKMAKVGEDIIKGLVDGMKSQKDFMSKEVKNISNALIKDFQGFFVIHSPSKKMNKEVGRYLPTGISEGFMDTLPKAERQITAGVERALQELQGRVESLQYFPAAIAPNISTQPQITVANNQPMQLNAEIHTTVDMDGKTVGKVVTPYVNQNLNGMAKREERGG